MREKYYLNNDWYFSGEWDVRQSKADYDETSMQAVRIPHTVKELPFHYFDEREYQMVSGYRRHLAAKPEWAGRKVRLTIEGAAHDSEVYVSSRFFGNDDCFALFNDQLDFIPGYAGRKFVDSGSYEYVQ